MNLIIIVGIAIFLSLDSFSVALTAGSINEKSSKRQWFFISLLFGISQFIAMILGFNIKLKYESIVLTLSYAVAFVVFLLFGIANFYNFFSLVKKEKKDLKISPKTVILLSLATSLDAFSAGMRFSNMEGNIISLAFIVAAFTLVMTMIGLIFGKKVKGFLSSEARIFSSLILFAVSIKIILDAVFTK